MTDKLKELAALRTKVAELEQAAAAGLNQELAGLPAQFGFDSADAFIAAVQAASGKRRGRKPGSVNQPKAADGKRRKRTKITDAMRAEVKQLVADGKTASEIAKAVGISEPSVANIKRALGLVRKKRK